MTKIDSHGKRQPDCPERRVTQGTYDYINTPEGTVPDEGEWTGTWTNVLLVNLRRLVREGLNLQNITDDLWHNHDGPARQESVEEKLKELGFWVEGMEREEGSG